jgi:hypothetical protein
VNRRDAEVTLGIGLCPKYVIVALREQCTGLCERDHCIGNRFAVRSGEGPGDRSAFEAGGIERDASLSRRTKSARVDS